MDADDPAADNTWEEYSGGIELEELQRSSVRDPDDPDRFWLLHKKCVQLVPLQRKEGESIYVADREQPVPICDDCRSALGAPVPKMPKFALANDLWMGKLPQCLAKMNLGSKALLPLVRGLIRRYNCILDSGYLPRDELTKGYVGNTVAFPQADGGAILHALPPQVEEAARRLVIALTGNDEHQSSQLRLDLGVDCDTFKETYDWLRDHNEIYSKVAWDEQAAAGLRSKDAYGLPSQLTACVYKQPPCGVTATRQEDRRGQPKRWRLERIAVMGRKKRRVLVKKTSTNSTSTMYRWLTLTWQATRSYRRIMSRKCCFGRKHARSAHYQKARCLLRKG